MDFLRPVMHVACTIKDSQLVFTPPSACSHLQRNNSIFSTNEQTRDEANIHFVECRGKSYRAFSATGSYGKHTKFPSRASLRMSRHEASSTLLRHVKFCTSAWLPLFLKGMIYYCVVVAKGMRRGSWAYQAIPCGFWDLRTPNGTVVHSSWRG